LPQIELGAELRNAAGEERHPPEPWALDCWENTPVTDHWLAERQRQRQRRDYGALKDLTSPSIPRAVPGSLTWVVEVWWKDRGPWRVAAAAGETGRSKAKASKKERRERGRGERRRVRERAGRHARRVVSG